jgi:hypothetical protein
MKLINSYLGSISIEQLFKDPQKNRDYRNALHAFQKRFIGSWDEFNNHIKDVIILTIDVLEWLESYSTKHFY